MLQNRLDSDKSCNILFFSPVQKKNVGGIVGVQAILKVLSGILALVMGVSNSFTRIVSSSSPVAQPQQCSSLGGVQACIFYLPCLC